VTDQPLGAVPFRPVAGRRVVLGVTGSIAAYKAADLASKLTQAGALVDVVLTESAARFAGEATFAALTQRPVTAGLYQASSDINIDHVALANRAEIVVVAPATANTIAKIALGLADDPLTATVLATSAPLLIAPAMDANMFESEATRHNVETLRARGVLFAGPETGRMASGMTGLGRMEEPTRIVGRVRAALGRAGDYAGRRVIVTAGGTQEPIDPVRIITNRSTGKMGYALAEAARDRGAQVTLVTAPTALPDPVAMELAPAETADRMRDEVLPRCAAADLLIMAAAVADFRPAAPARQKIKKSRLDGMSLELVAIDDWMPLATGPRLVRIAFAAETSDMIKNARAKLRDKGAHLIVANDVTQAGAGFGTDTNKVTILDRNDGVDDVPLMDKLAVAHRILDRALPFMEQPQTG